jgi:hypothetical protein
MVNWLCMAGVLLVACWWTRGPLSLSVVLLRWGSLAPRSYPGRDVARKWPSAEPASFVPKMTVIERVLESGRRNVP